MPEDDWRDRFDFFIEFMMVAGFVLVFLLLLYVVILFLGVME